jgi:hypothetical protein
MTVNLDALKPCRHVTRKLQVIGAPPVGRSELSGSLAGFKAPTDKSPSANREIGGPGKNKRMTVNLDAPKPGRHVTCKMQVMLL